MKRIILGVVAAVGLIAVACGPSGGLGAECTKYLACATKIGGANKTAAENLAGKDSACVKEPSVKDQCETSCKSLLESIKTSGLGADAGCA